MTVANIFFPTQNGDCWILGRPEFAHLLADLSGLSQTETQFKFSFDRLSGLARRALPREIHTLSHYDERTAMLAVSDGGSGMWIRERGGSWQRALNGENGIVFRTHLDADPWEPQFKSSPDGDSSSWIGSCSNFRSFLTTRYPPRFSVLYSGSACSIASFLRLPRPF